MTLIIYNHTIESSDLDAAEDEIVRIQNENKALNKEIIEIKRHLLTVQRDLDDANKIKVITMDMVS
jgi:predicted  nucleic acid-binding Zn-ribbon protein